jgi:geranylgeranyl reductase family protein
MTFYDVIVVGSGPAGATAARTCAKGGLKTLILESRTLPRDKPCGGGVSIAAAAALEFPVDESVIERRCRGVRFRYRSDESIVERDSTVMYMVTRRSFDAFLVEKAVGAGAELHEAEGFLSLDRPDERGIRLHTSRSRYRTRILIGADGALSRVRTFVTGNRKRQTLHLCTLAEIPLEETLITSRFGEHVTIHYEFAGPGYAWIFPRREVVSVGVGIVPDHSRDLADHLRAFLQENGLDSGVPIQGCFVPVPEGASPLYGDRILLAGDAAGFVDGFTGEGIRYAILSGRAAGQTALSACGDDDFSPARLGSYGTRCRDLFGEELDISLRVQGLLLKHGRVLLGSFLRDREALTGYLDVVRGARSLSEYADWLKKSMPLLPLKKLLSFFMPASDRARRT